MAPARVREISVSKKRTSANFLPRAKSIVCHGRHARTHPRVPRPPHPLVGTSLSDMSSSLAVPDDVDPDADAALRRMSRIISDCGEVSARPLGVS